RSEASGGVVEVRPAQKHTYACLHPRLATMAHHNPHVWKVPAHLVEMDWVLSPSRYARAGEADVDEHRQISLAALAVDGKVLPGVGRDERMEHHRRHRDATNPWVAPSKLVDPPDRIHPVVRVDSDTDEKPIGLCR